MQAIGQQSMPVGAISRSSLPEGALRFREGAFGCVAAFLKSASKGKTAVFDRKTFRRPEGGTGLGFGNC